MAIDNTPQTPSGLALRALGVSEESKLAGKNLDLNGDGQVSAAEIEEALNEVKKGERGARLGAPTLRLVQGGTSPDQVPAEMVPTYSAGARQVEDRTEFTLADVSFKFFDRAIFEAIRVSMAKTGKLPEMPPLEGGLVEMNLGAIRNIAFSKAVELLSEKDIVGKIGPSLRRNAA